MELIQIVFLLLSAGMYPLNAINKRILELKIACYNASGLINNQVAVFSPYTTYSSKTDKPCSGKVLKTISLNEAETLD